LVRVAADLERLARKGAVVTRYNLAMQTQAFLEQDEVQKLLQEKGPDILPVIVVDGRVRLAGRYPTAGELAAWSANNEKEAIASMLTKRESELVAIGAAIGSNCVPCIEYHVPEAIKAGLTVEEIRASIHLADNVKQTPARKILEAAFGLLPADTGTHSTTPCCSTQDLKAQDGSKCCG
jgi:4-carboxymuconolactone decarboxylase